MSTKGAAISDPHTTTINNGKYEFSVLEDLSGGKRCTSYD